MRKILGSLFPASLALALAATLGMAQDETAPVEPTPEAQAPEAEAPAEQPVEGPMTLPRLMRIVAAIDPEARFFGNAMELSIDDIPLIVITDPIADRMRAMVPIRSVDGMGPSDLMRLMQANFDSALDARYAVAQGRLWGVFIHPLSPLERDQFLSGLIQTINVARTYGQTYSGGAQVFGGGDTPGLYQELLDELRERGEAL